MPSRTPCHGCWRRSARCSIGTLVHRGLRRCLFGVESGVSSILERFNKETTGAQNALAIRTLTALGVPPHIYFLHSSDFGQDDEYLAGAVLMLRELREQGLIRAIGMRAPHEFAEEWATATGPRAAATTRWLRLFDRIQPDVVTARYNLLSPLYSEQQTDIFGFARRHQVGVLIKQALGQGLLLRDPASAPPIFSAADHRSRDPQFRSTALDTLDKTLVALRDRYGTNPRDLARVAPRYALQHAPDAALLVGFRDAGQITTTLTCLGTALSQGNHFRSAGCGRFPGVAGDGVEDVVAVLAHGGDVGADAEPCLRGGLRAVTAADLELGLGRANVALCLVVGVIPISG